MIKNTCSVLTFIWIFFILVSLPHLQTLSFLSLSFSVPSVAQYRQCIYSSPSSAIFVLSFTQRRPFPRCRCFHWVWLYCVLLEPRLDSAEDCFCFTQTHQETRCYWDTLLSFQFLFEFFRLNTPPLLSHSLSNFTCSLSFSLCMSPFLLSFSLCPLVCLRTYFEILPSWLGRCLVVIEMKSGVPVLSKLTQYLLNMLQLPNRFTPHLWSA